MRGWVSFHPLDVELFEGLIGPLVGGQKVNPESYLSRAFVLRSVGWRCQHYRDALREALVRSAPAPPPEHGSLWEKVRTRLESLDHRPDAVSVAVSRKIEPDLHLDGRPFLITEGSAGRVAGLVDEYLEADGDAGVGALILEQLVRLDPQLGSGIEPADGGSPGSDLPYRASLLDTLKTLYDLAQAARRGDSWGPVGRPRQPASAVLEEELAWRALEIHSRAVPFWIARDVDGLETICRAAGIEPPILLGTPRVLFERACDEFPGLVERLGTEIREARGMGAYVAPADVPELISFLVANGAHIIKMATRHGEGPMASSLLRKIRECATFAEKHGLGYLEGSGVLPVERLAEAEGEG